MFVSSMMLSIETSRSPDILWEGLAPLAPLSSSSSVCTSSSSSKSSLVVPPLSLGLGALEPACGLLVLRGLYPGMPIHIPP